MSKSTSAVDIDVRMCHFFQVQGRIMFHIDPLFLGGLL